jgi:hypothetical protein
VNSTIGAPSKASLVRIDVTTGKVTEVIALPHDTDPLTFAPESMAPLLNLSPQASVALAAFVAGIVIGILAVMVLRRRRTQPER